MAISTLNGFKAGEVTQGRMFGNEFVKIINGIAAFGSNTLVLLDNVSYHKSKATLKTLVKYEMFPVFNVPYTPDLNAIERVFSMLK